MATVTPRTISISVLVAALLGAMFLVVYSASAPAHDSKAAPSYEKPKALWSPESVNETIQPGQSRTIPVTLTADKELPESLVRVSPEIAPYVTVNPTTIGKTRKGTSIPLALTFSVPIDALPAVATGTITLQKAKQYDERDDDDADDSDSDHRRNGKVEKLIGKPLLMSINAVWPTIAAKSGVTISYPGTLQLFDQLNSETDTLTLTNFGGKYARGGLLPPGGMDIVFATLPALTGSLNDFVAGKLAAAQIESQEAVTVDGFNAIRVTYVEQFSSSFSMKYVDVYVPTPTALHRVSLAYNPGDPNEASYLTTLQRVLDSANFP